MRRRSLGTWVLRRSRPRSPRSSSCTTEATTNSSRRFVPMRFRRCSSGIRNRPCEIVDGSRSSAKSPRLAGTCWGRKPGGNRSWRRGGNTSVLPGFDSSLAKCFNPMGPVYRRTMILEPEILDVREPPGEAMGEVARLWKPVEGTNKIMCTACARYCKIGEGQVGLCGIRGVHEGKLWLYVYGRVITGHVDPIEKKPVSHYRPGSKIFSIATTGCNWLCHPAGTSILMADGAKREVDDIRPGDRLWSYNIDGGYQILPSVVTHVGERLDWIYKVRVGSRGSSSLQATAEHPVLTQRGWVLVRDLAQSDRVLKVWDQNTEAWKTTRAASIISAD